MKTFCLALLVFGCITVHAQDPNPQEAARALVDNEAKFLQRGQEQGARTAFLEFLAEDAIVFEPGPVSARQHWTKRPEDAISLKWKPAFAAIAQSADLGYTTGPAEWRKKKEDEKPFGYGQYASIWKKQKDGNWKVAVDLGIQVPGAPKEGDSSELEYALSGAAPGNKADAAAKKLRETEGNFAAAAKADSTIALTEASATNVRVLREGVYPAVGKAAARLMLSVRRGKLAAERLGGSISGAGDLAYSYGKYTLVKPQETERGYYLQIWRAEADGSWKIALDFQSPLPAGK